MKTLTIFFRLASMLMLIHFLFLSTLSAQTEVNGKGIVGQWRVVDLKTDEDKKVMEIWEKEGEYFARIIELVGVTSEEANASVCKKCSDKRKGQKLLGMEIISNMKKGEEKYTEGEIMDLIKGKIYKCALWLENEDRLKVRTLVPIIFKDEVWFRKS